MESPQQSVPIVRGLSRIEEADAPGQSITRRGISRIRRLVNTVTLTVNASSFFDLRVTIT